MKHKKIKELLPLYIDDSDNGLTDNEKNLIKEHLKDCPECQKELNEYQENYSFLTSLEEKAPDGFKESILEKVGGEMKNNNVNENKDLTILERIKGYFTLPVRIPAGLIGLTAIIALVLITGIPGSLINNNLQDNQYELQEQSYGYQTQDISFNNRSSQPAPLADMKSANEQGQSPNMLTSSPDMAEVERKIIMRANLSIEIKNIDVVDSRITKLIENYNGYISDSSSWVNQNKQKFYHYQLRIPADNFNQFLSELDSDNFGQVLSRSVSAQDVTEEYMDLDIRLRNLLAQEERYRELLHKAEEVEEILQIEKELTRVRTDIERLQGRQKYLDNQINYSTITVDFRQPEPISSGTPGIIKALRNALNTMVKHIYQIINLIGTLIPYLFLLLLIYFIYKRLNRR